MSVVVFVIVATTIYNVFSTTRCRSWFFESRCALHSSALSDGVFRLRDGSARTVAAHFSMGLTEHQARPGRLSIGAAAGKIAFVLSLMGCISPHPLARIAVTGPTPHNR